MKKVFMSMLAAWITICTVGGTIQLILHAYGKKTKYVETKKQ